VDVRYVNALLSVLRLFFNQLQRVVALITGDNGQRFLQAPFGVFTSSATQSMTANVAAPVAFETNQAGNAVAVVGAQALTPEFTGIYQLTVGLQFANSGAAAVVSVWLSIDGVAVVDSGCDVPVSAGGTAATPAWLLPLIGQAAVRVMWSTPSGLVTLAPSAARVTPTRPTRPSATATLVLVSAALNE
jgi:hypothetical protein